MPGGKKFRPGTLKPSVLLSPSYRWRAHTTESDIRSKLHGFTGHQPLLLTRRLPGSRRPPRPRPAPPADAELRGAGPVARPRPPRREAGLRRGQRCTCPGRRRAPGPAPVRGPQPRPSAPSA